MDVRYRNGMNPTIEEFQSFAIIPVVASVHVTEILRIRSRFWMIMTGNCGS